MNPIIHRQWANARGCELQSQAEHERMARSAARMRRKQVQAPRAGAPLLPRRVLALLGVRSVRPAR
jgi:hypothetical protein